MKFFKEDYLVKAVLFLIIKINFTVLPCCCPHLDADSCGPLDGPDQVTTNVRTILREAYTQFRQSWLETKVLDSLISAC